MFINSFTIQNQLSFRLLEFHPLKRITAKQGKSHEWFDKRTVFNQVEINTDQFRKLLIQRRWKMLKVSLKGQ